MNIPSVITAGDSPSWREPGPFLDGLGNAIQSTGGWAMTFAFRGPTAGLDLAGTAFGSGWQFDMTAANSTALNGTAASTLWYWTAQATKAAAALTLGAGVLRVLPNLAALNAATTYDGRSQAEKNLATVDAAIQARISGDFVTEYTIGSRSLKKEPMQVLSDLRRLFARQVRAQRAKQAQKNGLGNPGRLGVRFK